MSGEAAHQPQEIPAEVARYVQIIRTALWRNNAAVMIGSGFSRNARPIAASARPFPLWNDLTNRLFDDLYPIESMAESQRERQRASYTTRALELAERYEATFGRTQLDNVLLELIPDGEYQPGELHKMLLRLPWADVLTTNYDTLLERTRESVPDRTYGLLQSIEDIAHSSRARIVKLHGSFPSTRPFIFTEEDFRTYPRQFAGFVNLAQQSAMENVLCLIGFSGDDPNFLTWTGWVRDHLGEHSPRIYLCGLFDHDEITRSLLNRRNVTALNLAACFPRTRYPDPTLRHRYATEWLLRCLDQDSPKSMMEWPETTQPPALPPYLPPLVGSHRRTPKDQPTEVSITDDLRKLRDIWKHNRELYPGWVIAPSSTRLTLWWSFRHLDDKICQLFTTTSSLEQLTILVELNWVLEISLCPILNHLTPMYEKCLQKFSLFPDEWDTHSDAEFVIGQTQLPKLHAWNVQKSEWHEVVKTWDDVKRDWLSVLSSLLRHYREERRDQDFLNLSGKLTKITSLTGDQRAWFEYERCLYFLERFDDVAARGAIEAWPTTTTDPMWAIRRAGMLAELGEHESAKQITKMTLNSIRQGQRVGVDSIPVYSR
ncbi:MAG: SIR2 family NAD-dependent protein deacylase, partial [Gemmataceae bacterium]